MYSIKVEDSFDSAHFLANYVGKCSNIHGHRWKVEVSIENEKLEDNGKAKGMLIDFSELKKSLKIIVDELDHSLIIEKFSLKEKTLNALRDENFKIIEVDFRPTAENFSKYFYDAMKMFGYNMEYVTVFETPNNSATYRGE